METGDATVPRFCSTFTHEVDDKRRVQIPAKWRTEKEGMELYLILWLKFAQGPCIRVLPPEIFEKLLRSLDEMPNSDPSKPTLKRLIGSNAESVTVDKAGRICLPDRVAVGAGITKKAVFAGMMDRFEIWSPERYEKIQTADQVLALAALEKLE